jgi:hypothetical protein
MDKRTLKHSNGTSQYRALLDTRIPYNLQVDGATGAIGCQIPIAELNTSMVQFKSIEGQVIATHECINL